MTLLKPVSFEDKQLILYEDVTTLRAERTLLRDLFSQVNQHQNTYDTLGQTRRVIENAISNDLVITLAKLFDIFANPNLVHLKSLINETEKNAINGAIVGKKKEYIQKIEGIKRKLDALRDTSRAHNLPSKIDPYPPRTWLDIDSWIDLAEEIFMCCMESLGRAWPKTKETILLRRLPEECSVLLQKFKEMIDASEAKRQQLLS